MTSSAASALRSYDNRLSYNRIFHATLQQQCYYFGQNFNSFKKNPYVSLTRPKSFQQFNNWTLNYDYLHQLWKYICHISTKIYKYRSILNLSHYGVWCWSLLALEWSPIFTSQSIVFSLCSVVGVGVTGPLQSTNWSSMVIQAISSIMNSG